MSEIQGTPLFDEMWDAEGPHQTIMRQVWTPTPWMVDAFTGGVMSDRDAAIRLWCIDRFGPECWPLHGRFGRWQRGGVTLHGWTWFGFSTCEELLAFETEWPSHPESARSKDTASAQAAENTDG